MHDIAKGRPGDHSEVGAQIALDLCPQLEFDAPNTELIAWLVRFHLKLSDTAFRRDLDDNQTIEEFANFAKSEERLRLLMILTVADITAVGPSVWNNWKANLINKLFKRTMQILAFSDDNTASNFVINLTEICQDLNITNQEITNKITQIIPIAYYQSQPLDLLHHHISLIVKGLNDPQNLAINFTDIPKDAICEIAIFCPDKKGLLTDISGALAIMGFNVMNARIYNFHENFILDVFKVQSLHQELTNFATQAKLKHYLQKIIFESLDPLSEIQKKIEMRTASRHDVFMVNPVVEILNQASQKYSLIEIQGRDRTGLLFMICRALLALNITIYFAKIATFGEQAVDVFYVQDENGQKITDDVIIQQIKSSLITILWRANDANGSLFL